MPDRALQLLTAYLFILFYRTERVILFYPEEIFILFYLHMCVIMLFYLTLLLSSCTFEPIYPLLPVLFVLFYLTQLFILFYLAYLTILFYLVKLLLTPHSLLPCRLIVSPGMDPGYLSSSPAQNNIVQYCVLKIRLLNMTFVALHRVGQMIYRECCIDRLFLYHVTGAGWEPSPPPPHKYRHWVAYFNRLFGA